MQHKSIIYFLRNMLSLTNRSHSVFNYNFAAYAIVRLGSCKYKGILLTSWNVLLIYRQCINVLRKNVFEGISIINQSYYFCDVISFNSHPVSNAEFLAYAFCISQLQVQIIIVKEYSFCRSKSIMGFKTKIHS